MLEGFAIATVDGFKKKTGCFETNPAKGRVGKVIILLLVQKFGLPVG